MAAPTSPAPEERGANKRQKGDDQTDGDGGPTYQQRGMPQRYPPPQQHYGGPPPPIQQPGGYMWAQYGGGPPPPHGWGQQGPHPGGPPGGPPAIYPQRAPPPGADRPPPSDWNGYRNGPPPLGGPHGRSPPPAKGKDGGPMDEDVKSAPRGPPQPYSGWSPHGGPQWQHPQYGPPPGGWQGSGPPMHQPPPMYQGNWSNKSPPRGRVRPDVMTGYNPRGDMDMTYMGARGPGGPHDDDGASSSAGGSVKEKGRGSYKCGRCGVPKKGHVCPYQPKLKRRPDEPPPELRNAAVQVEMDEFLTLRRLNIKIQGLPESYATEPYMGDNVLSEPHPLSGPPPLPPDSGPSMMHESPMNHPVPTPSEPHPPAPRDPPPPASPSAPSPTTEPPPSVAEGEVSPAKCDLPTSDGAVQETSEGTQSMTI